MSLVHVRTLAQGHSGHMGGGGGNKKGRQLGLDLAAAARRPAPRRLRVVLRGLGLADRALLLRREGPAESEGVGHVRQASGVDLLEELLTCV